MGKIKNGGNKMKPFHTIAIPHIDVLEGKRTMDVYAAIYGKFIKIEQKSIIKILIHFSIKHT